MGQGSLKNSTLKNRILQLRDVLGNDRDFNTGHFLYLPKDQEWDLNTKCAVISESDVDGIPEFARKNGLSYILGMAAIQDIGANAREQIKKVTLDTIFQAFLFYYKHDAFINLKSDSPKS